METIDALRAAGYEVWLEGDLVAWQWMSEGKPDPKLVKHLIERLKQEKTGAVEALRTQTPESAGTGKRVVVWDVQTSELIRWYSKAVLPTGPFYLAPWIYVTVPQRFYASLQSDIQAGPSGPRARTGAVQDNLMRLAALFRSGSAGGQDGPYRQAGEG